MTTATTTRQQMIAEADAKKSMAEEAHKRGDVALRNSYVRQARDRYRDLGMTGMVKWCERFLG